MTHRHRNSEECPFNVYCDESRHTSDQSDAYMVIGALSCPRDDKLDIVSKIKDLRKAHSTYGEFGWKRLSPNKRDFYWDLLRLFAADERLRFRCVVVNRRSLNHEEYNDGDAELGFYKLYYQMLVHWLQRGCDYHIYLDLQSNREQRRFITLRDILQRKLSGVARIACLEPDSSKQQLLIQLVDLLIGAVGYEWNVRKGSATKEAFCRDLAGAVGLRTLRTSTPLGAEKFNIFHFQGRDGG